MGKEKGLSISFESPSGFGVLYGGTWGNWPLSSFQPLSRGENTVRSQGITLDNRREDGGPLKPCRIRIKGTLEDPPAHSGKHGETGQKGLFSDF
jgi:hypothetical protein